MDEILARAAEEIDPAAIPQRQFKDFRDLAIAESVERLIETEADRDGWRKLAESRAEDVAALTNIVSSLLGLLHRGVTPGVPDGLSLAAIKAAAAAQRFAEPSEPIDRRPVTAPRVDEIKW